MIEKKGNKVGIFSISDPEQDPDPYQNETDPKHCFLRLTIRLVRRSGAAGSTRPPRRIYSTILKFPPTDARCVTKCSARQGIFTFFLNARDRV